MECSRYLDLSFYSRICLPYVMPILFLFFFLFVRHLENEPQNKTTTNQKRNISEYFENGDVDVVTSSLGFDENSNEIATAGLLSSSSLHSNSNRPDDDVDEQSNNESLVEQAVLAVKREITFEKQNSNTEQGDGEEEDEGNSTKKIEIAFGSWLEKTERSNTLDSERSRKHSQTSRKSSVKVAELDDEPPKIIEKPPNKSKKKRKSTKKSKVVENDSTIDITHRKEENGEPVDEIDATPHQVVETHKGENNQFENENLSNSKDSLQSTDRNGTRRSV